MRFSEAEQCFMEDVREKKKAALGVHSKTGKNGYTGKILFPTDFMTRKEKYNHRKASKVMTTNLFDTILPIDEFNKLDTHEQKNRMQYWRTNYNIKDIQTGMGIWNKKFYEIVDELELPKGMPRVRGKARTGSTATAKPKQKQKAIAITSQLEMPIVEEEPKAPIQEIIVDGLHVMFNGTFSAEKIEKQLTKFMLLLEGETDEFYIEMKLMQKQPKE